MGYYPDEEIVEMMKNLRKREASSELDKGLSESESLSHEQRQLFLDLFEEWIKMLDPSDRKNLYWGRNEATNKYEWLKVYDPLDAARVMLALTASHLAWQPLTQAYSAYLPAIIQKFISDLKKKPIDKAIIEDGFCALSYVVGPQRFTLCPSLMAKSAAKCDGYR